MNRLQSNDLSVIVNIQYGIGFEFIDGKVEIETTIFNKTQKSRAVPAGRNRINFYEEFIWETDRVTLKHSRTTNEVVKFECFTTPEMCFGNINRRQRIGHIIIKLKEFQVLGRDWDQCVSIRGYKLQGSHSSYELRIVLIIQDGLDMKNPNKEHKKNTKFNGKQNNFINEKYNSSEVNKEGSIKNKNKSMSQAKEKHIIKSQSLNVKNDLKLQENLNRREDNMSISNNVKNNKNQNFWNSDLHNELNMVKKKIEQAIRDSKEPSITNECNEYYLKKLLASCLDHTDSCIKMMKIIKTYFDVNNINKNSSNSSIQSENDSEQQAAMMKVYAIKKQINELTDNVNGIFERIKYNKKNKRSREISNLKTTNCMLSELCEIIANKCIGDEVSICSL